MSNPDPESKIVRFEERAGYLYAFMSGKRDSVEDAFEYWASILDECARRGFARLLVEQEFEKPLTPIGAFSLIVRLIRWKTVPARVAFVDRDLSQTPVNRFGETVAVNRGVTARVFATAAEAEAWLIGTP